MRATNFPLVMHRASATGHDNVIQTLPAGEIIPMQSNAALNVGEYVYIAAANQVNKSAVAATVLAAAIGVVVGSPLAFPDNTIPENIDTLLAGLGVPSIVAANAAGQEVWIQYSGLALVYCTGALAVGGTVIPGATAGQVVAGATAGSVIGFNVGPALAGAGWALIKLERR
jgi:hypothetical protein